MTSFANWKTPFMTSCTRVYRRLLTAWNRSKLRQLHHSMQEQCVGRWTNSLYWPKGNTYSYNARRPSGKPSRRMSAKRALSKMRRTP